MHGPLTPETATAYVVALHARHGEAVTVVSTREAREDGEAFVYVRFWSPEDERHYSMAVWRQPDGTLYGEI